MSSVGLFSAFLSPSEAPGKGRRGHSQLSWWCLLRVSSANVGRAPWWGHELGTLFLQGKPTLVTPPNTAQPPDPQPCAHHPRLCSPPASWPPTPHPSSQPRAGKQRDAEWGDWGFRGVLTPHRQEFGETPPKPTLTFFLSSWPFLRSLLAMMTPVRSVSNTGSLLFAAGNGEGGSGMGHEGLGHPKEGTPQHGDLPSWSLVPAYCWSL